MKPLFKCLLSGVLSMVMTVSAVPIVSAHADESTEPYPYIMFAASDDEGAITINAGNFCANGNVATNGTIVSSGNMNINGKKIEYADESMIFIFDKIDNRYFSSPNVEEHDEDYTLDEMNININIPTEVQGEATLTGNINISNALKALGDVNLYGEVKNTNDSIIFSMYGDIVIDSWNVNLNGLVYAPFGDVEVTAQNLNLNNVVIIADTITLNCPNVNANCSGNVAEFVGVDTEDYVIPYDDYIYLLDSNSDIYGFATYDDFPNELIQLNDTTSKYTDAEIEYYGETVQEYISDINEIYGMPIDMLTELTYEDIARIVISSRFGIDSNAIVIGEPINLLDANNVVTYVGYNYRIEENIGYITVATHSKEVLIRDIVEGEFLPVEFGDLYYLSSGEFYYNNTGYYTLDGVYIEEEEFKDFLNARKNDYYNFTTNILADLENSLISQLNNIIYIDNYGYEEEYLQKSYNGQSGSGYGGIDDCKKYLKDRYGGTITLSSSKTLSMADFKQSRWSDKNNCTLAAITRILYYYYETGYTKIDSSYDSIYSTVKKVAEKYGYTNSNGTSPTKINNIVDDVLKDYGYSKSKCKGIYVWNFNDQVKKEINAERPVIMNIARGYYGNHTVTVCGYAVYKRTKKFLGIKTTKTYNMIQVYDGCSTSKEYIDYLAFAYDLITSGFGSFNTITMKK